MRNGAVWAAGLALAVFLLACPLLSLQAPGFTRGVSERFSQAEEAGLPPAMMRQLAETVRTFVVRGVGALPATVDGRSGFDAAAVSHLEDVRDVLRGVRVATYALGLILSALLIWALVRKRALEIAAVLLIGGGVAAGAVALAAVAATTDFYTFFSAFHGLFFRAGTWTFPYDSLLIQLFPQPFWMVAGGVWAGLSAVLGAIAVIAGLVVRRSVRGAGA